LNSFEISGLAEEPSERIHTWGKEGIGREAGDKLSFLYLKMGQGVFTLEEIKAGTGLDGRQITSSAAQVGNALPEELFSAEGKGRERTFTFGDFRVASRMASNGEVEALTAELEAKVEQAFADKKEAVHAAEETKTNLTEVDHALIRTGEKTFYMPITTYSAVLAIRTFEAIKTLYGTSKHLRVPFSELHRLMWDNMTLAERQLFTNNERQLYGNGNPLEKLTDKVVAAVMSPLGIARRSRHANEVELGNNPHFTVDIMLEPPEEPYDPATVTPLYPPGTEKALLYADTPLGETPPEEVTVMTATLESLLNARRLTHDQAVSVLDILTDARAKGLARRILNQHFGVADAEATLGWLNRRTAAALAGGYRYYSGRRHRTIKGNIGAPGVQQVSGELPGRTFKHVGEKAEPDVTTKWHFGKREN